MCCHNERSKHQGKGSKHCTPSFFCCCCKNVSELLSTAIFSRPPTSIRGKIMNLLGSIFRSGSIHIWSSNGCFQRHDGVSGSSHTFTVTLADVHLIDFGPRWGCKSTQPGIYQTAAPKGAENGRLWEWINGCRWGQGGMEDAAEEGVILSSRWRRLLESCHWLMSTAWVWCGSALTS